MGLDISAYGNLKHVGTLGKEEDFYESELYSDDLIAMESYRFDDPYSSYTDGMGLFTAVYIPMNVNMVLEPEVIAATIVGATAYLK